MQHMADFEIGSIVDERYEILGILGSGGMGRVYKARQLNLNRIVAIKVPSDAVLKNEEFLARFVREGTTCARVAHGHIVSIYDVHSGKRPYIVMEYVDGMPLNQFLQEEQTTLFVSDLLEIIGQVCQGLEAAHASGVVHRDIKPANIVITHEGHRVKVMDFGIARVSDNSALTTASSMMGTPFYMAPEQIKGEGVSPATDLYALACLVYYLFTGKLVFDGEVATLIYKHVSVKPVPPYSLNPMLPRSLDAVLLRGLSKNPRERYPSALEFHRELCKAMRPIAQLPYSQIFTPPQPAVHPAPQQKTPGTTLASQRTLTGDPKLQPTASPRDRAKAAPAAALGEPDLEGRMATLQPESAGSPAAAAAQSAPVSVPAAHAPAFPAAAPVPELVPRRRAMAWLLGGAGLVIVAAVVIVVAPKWGTNTSNGLPGGSAPRVTPSMQPVAPTPAVSSPAPLIQRKLTWLPDQDSVSGEYTVGEYVSAWWCVESMVEPALPPAWYAVQWTNKTSGDIVWSRKTLEQKLAFPLAKAGSYTLTVQALDAGGRPVGTLEADLEVQEALER